MGNELEWTAQPGIHTYGTSSQMIPWGTAMHLRGTFNCMFSMKSQTCGQGFRFLCFTAFVGLEKARTY